MDLIDNVVRYFQHREKHHRQDAGIADPDHPENAAPEGIRPVCCGYQQYEGKIRDLLEDRQIDINNHRDSYMLIQDFLKTRVEGIRLKEGVVSECPSCSDASEA